jgi:hypothetical protein
MKLLKRGRVYFKREIFDSKLRGIEEIWWFI